jgi:hypothetical protein
MPKKETGNFLIFSSDGGCKGCTCVVVAVEEGQQTGNEVVIRVVSRKQAVV